MVKPDKAIARWLYACAGAVFLMALLGAVTRLTESGLSIVEWRPVTGVLLPADDAAWNHEFGLYQSSPQYQKVNAGMSLEEFKKIYFWEWLHRLWGRMIGILYFLPFVWFWARGRIPGEARGPLLAIAALGFLQGGMGWLMVKSGLVDQPAVSHYRLMAHLGLAFIIFCGLWRMGLVFSVPRDVAAEKMSGLRKMIVGLLALAGLAMVWGAFVAGLRAGLVYGTSFPFMGKYLWPTEMLRYTPWWANFLENHAAVQFTHRVLAVLVLAKALYVAARGISANVSPGMNRLFTVLWVLVCVQAGLGITTLMTQVHIVAATLHQAGAVALLAVLMTLLHHIPKKT